MAERIIRDDSPHYTPWAQFCKSGNTERRHQPIIGGCGEAYCLHWCIKVKCFWLCVVVMPSSVGAIHEWFFAFLSGALKFKRTHHRLMSSSRYRLTYPYQHSIDQFQCYYTKVSVGQTLDWTCWIKAVRSVSHLFDHSAVSEADMGDDYTRWFARLDCV